MRTRLLLLSIFVALLLVGGYTTLKFQTSKARVRNASAALPIADFEPAPAVAPKTPFRLVWQQVNLSSATISPDWKFLAQTHGASTSLISTASGRFVRRVKGTPYPPGSPKVPADIARLHPKIRNENTSANIEAWSRKAQLVAIHGWKSSVYSLSTGRKLWGLTAPQYGPKVFLGFSPNGKWVLTREGDQYGDHEKHFLRDARTGTIYRRFHWPSSSYDATLGFSPDSRRFGVFDQGVKFYAIPSGKPVFRYDGFRYSVSTVEFSRDSQSVITSDGGEMVAVWNTQTGRIVRSWHARYNASGALAISPDGKFLASGSDGSCGRDLVRVWNFAGAKELWVTPSGYNSWGVSNVKWSPDGTLLATASGRSGAPQIWNARTGKRVAILGGVVRGRGTQAYYPDNSIERSEPTLFWSSDARELWVGGTDGLKIWSRDGKLLRAIKTAGKIASIARCPSGQRVVIGTSDGEILLLRVKDEAILWRKTVGDQPLGVAFLPSDRVISWSSLGAYRHKIFVWDARGGFTTQTLEAPLGTRQVAVSRDGKRLVVVGNDGLMLWETAPETGRSQSL